MMELLDGVVRLGKDRRTEPAVVHLRPGGGAETTTYGDLAARARRFARYLATAAPDAQIIPLYLTKSADCIAAAMGTLGAGKVFAILNRKFRPPQIERVIADTESPILVVDGPTLLSLRSVAIGGSALSRVHWVVLRDSRFSRIQEKAIEALRGQVELSVLSLSDETPPISEATLPSGHPQRPASAGLPAGCCLFTSGSTGAPKGVLIDATDLVRRAKAEVRWFDLSQSDVLLSLLPFSFDVGLNQMLSTLTIGARLVIVDSWLPADILTATAAWDVTGISGVPSIWRDMINADLAFDTTSRHQSLRYVTVSGGSLDSSHLERLSSIAPGVGIIKTYGQTEAFRSTCLLPEDFERYPDSVGRPFEGARVYILGEDGTACLPGEIGEVVHSGLGTMRGYLGADSAGKLAPNPFHGPDDRSEQVVLTGDRGYVNDEGFLFLKGREDRMLKIAGNRVYPEEILHQILAVEGVTEAELVDLPDDAGDTRLVAFVVARGGANLDTVILTRELAKRLPSYMLPQTVEFLHKIPRTESGKTDHPRLIRDAQARSAAAGKPAQSLGMRPSLECF